MRRSRLPLPWIHCSDTKIASKNSSNSARGRQCESKAPHGAQKRAPESKPTSTEMQIPQKNRQNQNPRNTINKEINPNFGEKCFGSHLNNQLYVTGGCNWREMTSLSWVPEAGRSDVVLRLCGGYGAEMMKMMTHEGGLSEWVGCTEKDKNPKAKLITHRRKRTQTQTQIRRRRRKIEIHQSSEWVCPSFQTKLISMSATSKFFGRKIFRTWTIWLINVKLSSAQNHFSIHLLLYSQTYSPYCCSNSAWFKHSEFWSKLNYLLCQDFLPIRQCLRTHCTKFGAWWIRLLYSHCQASSVACQLSITKPTGVTV